MEEKSEETINLSTVRVRHKSKTLTKHIIFTFISQLKNGCIKKLFCFMKLMQQFLNYYFAITPVINQKKNRPYHYVNNPQTFLSSEKTTQREFTF